MRARLSAATIGIALLFGAATASAQQTSTPTQPTRQCTVNRGAVSYDATAPKVTPQPESRATIDTATRPVKVNNAGNSVPINTTNTTSGNMSDVGAGGRATVDSSRVPNVPKRNSERNAVKVNVGGGSVPVTDVNSATSKSTVKDSTTTVPAVVIDCTDSTRTRNP